MTSCAVEPWGLVGDRRWMVVDADGDVITAREANRLVLVVPEITAEGLRLCAPGMPELVVERPTAGPLVDVDIWRDRLEARLAGHVAADWFSAVIDRPARLVYLDDPRRRPIDPAYAQPGQVVSLADGFPLLLASEESLDQLNAWIAQGPCPAEGPVPMTRFRPNLVVRGAGPFAEDRWLRLRVGEVVFKVVKPCDRCVLTTIDPDTARRTKEPLVSLARHRKVASTTLFAMNLIPEQPYGCVRHGDAVEVLDAR